MMKSTTGRSALLAGTVLMFALGGCATAPRSADDKRELERKAAVALKNARQSDPTLINIFNSSAGYAVFPTVGKGAAGVGAAYGKGVLYERDRVVGYCDLSQATIGLQLGGQAYTEIIAFESKPVVDSFKNGNFNFDAQASAVALKSGAGANASFANGVAVFTMDESGLMYEASVGGQKFGYQAK